jgi:3-oxoadipate enol-lactonase
MADWASDWVPELPPGRPITLPGRGRVFVREAGPPDAPAIFLLHGWTATADLNWFPTFPALGEHYRLVAFDHRGHGRGIRTRRRFRLVDCADDVIAVADALGVDRFVAVGYSMGGPIASLVWRRHRDRVLGLVMCATACRFGNSRLERAQLAAFGPVAMSTRVMPRSVSKPMFDRLIWTQTRNSGLHPWILGQIRSGDPRHVLEAGWELRCFDSRSWIREVDVPTAAIVVDGDIVCPTAHQDEMVALLDPTHVVRIEGGHDVCIRHPRRFNRALLEACDAVLASRQDVAVAS